MHSLRNYFLLFLYWHQDCVYTATLYIQREGAKVRIHICEGANTYFKIDSSKYFPAFGPQCHVFAQNKFLPEGLGFVPGGIGERAKPCWSNPPRPRPIVFCASAAAPPGLL